MQKLFTLKVLLSSIAWVSSSIAGLSYMDPLNYGPYKPAVRNEDPCNPLYWYPRNIPDYCYRNKIPKPTGISLPLPMSPPAQPLPSIPMPQPYPFPTLPPLPMPPFLPYPPPLHIPPPLLPLPLVPSPLPYGIPLQPSNPMLPVAGLPFSPTPYQPQEQIGFLPGIQGIVNDDGGINILPFSDAYADLLEKHKQKMIRKKYQKIIDQYDGYPWKSKQRCRSKKHC